MLFSSYKCHNSYELNCPVNISHTVDNFPGKWNAKAGTAYTNQNVALHVENGVSGRIDNNVIYTQQAVKLAPGQEVDIIYIIDRKRRRQQGFCWHAVSLAVGCTVVSVQALRTTLVVRIENITPNVLEVHKNIVRLSSVKGWMIYFNL